MKINHTWYVGKSQILKSRYFKSGNLIQGGGYTSVEGIKVQNETLRKYKDSSPPGLRKQREKDRCARASSFEELELRLLRRGCARLLGVPRRQ